MNEMKNDYADANTGDEPTTAVEQEEAMTEHYYLNEGTDTNNKAIYSAVVSSIQAVTATDTDRRTYSTATKGTDPSNQPR